ncbi:Gfo/Idh/MocA family protein [Sphaerochaeta globosa]|uniref:Oxidoreductase domain protein n=1 Tax=Sphaerochaeta globosa (strain ATCC BAA-1886 / DSM 22777 / Buddy) TaxID=158189 RepID=F0RZL0_SPHGB|nr:Gfo/Idh/MocA family oxidoreductase [Sphaerochaeta globosa]ADY14761.1 oxidoreductase domain protein [Sphaerochaeta globosa str. Buddy]
MKRFNIGFIGCGFAAHIHAQAYKKIPGYEVRLYGACSADLKQTQQFVQVNGFEKAFATVEELLRDPLVDIVDIIVPPSSHIPLVKQAMESGKHVICEKPLNGYFGSGNDDRSLMYDAVCQELEDLRLFLLDRKEKLFYAENYIYAPAVVKIKEMIEATGEKLLLLKGDEAHSGSHAAHAALWSANGGGCLIRQGCHPLSALLYLKQVEAKRRGEQIRVTSVLCDASRITTGLPRTERGSILSNPVDVEDWSEAILTFSDGTKAVITSGDMIVGGVRNKVEAYTSNACYEGRIAPNDSFLCYHTDASKLEDVYMTEKVETKTGWQHVFLCEEEMRGYVGELEDFIKCVDTGREPESGFPLAYETMKVLYAAYASAGTDKRFFME